MYQNSITDTNGYIHSIDNIVVDYFLMCTYKTVTEKLLEVLSHFGFIQDSGSKIDVAPSHRYEFYKNLIWYDGFTFSLGKYGHYDKKSSSWVELDMMRFKVNPNKHDGTPLMDAVVKFLKEYCRSGILVRYDYAIDIKCSLADIVVLNTRKEKGLYKGTRYLGQRHKHGYCKIYDKQSEQNLDYVLSRIEYTFTGDGVPGFDDIMIRAPSSPPDGAESLSEQLKLYLDMMAYIVALGGDIDEYMHRLNFRSRKKIEPYLYTGVKLNLDKQTLDTLLKYINDKFILDDYEENVNPVETEFMIYSGSVLPFD